ncbi:MAG: hypothetical protein QF893_07515 [Alphaproteobacteria bacterium]|jgi:hypothetical protein|nr:hypothetical protein [Alphaproteobacteria bacterium]
MKIEGRCHCGNISYVLRWPGEGTKIPVRACSCTFCTKHGGTYTSHRDAELAVIVHDEAFVSQYRFGTETAEFHLCSRCGVVPFVTSMIEGKLYAVVNVNSFEGIDPSCYSRAVTDFDGEKTEDRLDRRKRNWISSVTISR